MLEKEEHMKVSGTGIEGFMAGDANYAGFTREGQFYLDRRLRTSSVVDARESGSENSVTMITESGSEYTVEFEEGEYHSYFGLSLKAEILFRPAFLSIRGGIIVGRLG